MLTESLYFQKFKGREPIPNHSVLGSVEDFSMYVSEIEWPNEMKVKDMGAQSIPGEHGERVYFPKTLSFEAFDFSVTFMYKGPLSYVNKRFAYFRNYLAGIGRFNGTELAFYSPLLNMGKCRVHLASMEDPRLVSNGNDSFFSVVVKFRVTDPAEDVEATETIVSDNGKDKAVRTISYIDFNNITI